MNEDQRAEHAKRLLGDEYLRAFLEEIREDQWKTFKNSAAADVERREEAHRMLRVVNALVGKLDGAVKRAAEKERKRDG